MTTTKTLSLLPILALCLAGSALAADAPAPAPTTAAAPAAPELTPEQRQEVAFRQVQLGMERVRSEKAEDEQKIVCLKQKPTGSNLPVINCASNYFWNRIRAASLSDGIGSVNGAVGGGGSGGTGKKEEKALTLTLNQYNELEHKYGKLPKEWKDKI